MAKFYKQDKGIINPPPGFKKWHISWTLDNVLSGFKKFYEENKRWPIGVDLMLCDYLPNVKTLERNFGGITKIREHLKLKSTNYSKGDVRSSISKIISKRGLNFEEKVYKILVDRFHEPYVHCQSRIILDNVSINVDFIIFYSNGKFAIDVFYPDSKKQRYSNNISIKYNTYKNFPYKIYLCIGNETISRNMINENLIKSKNYRNPNIELVLFSEFIELINKYMPLKNPYSKGS